MIISVSRRTDIPAFYSDWFFNRLKAGYVLVANPRNPTMFSKILLNTQVVDCLVFWTKNPQPMLKKLDQLHHYNFYFQFTLTPYDKDIEAHLPTLAKRIAIFQQLSRQIGKERLIWRYDPIFISDKYSMDYHINMFEQLALQLRQYTDVCIISFLDNYRHIQPALSLHNISSMTQAQMNDLAQAFSEIAIKYNLLLTTCAEQIDLIQFNIEHGACIDKSLIEKLTHQTLKIKPDQQQREQCCCVASIDIGTYNTCLHGCIYCYAVTNHQIALGNLTKHDKNSPILFGQLKNTDIILDKKMIACLSTQ